MQATASSQKRFCEPVNRKIEKAFHLILQEKREATGMVKLNKTDEKVVAILKTDKELTLQEIADKSGETPKKIFRSLRKLFEQEIVSTQARKYKLTGKMPSGKNDEDSEKLPE